jgi:molybdenum cofactor cytidylyltransferase
MNNLPVGLLLAAGRGHRFDPSGTTNKLLARLNAANWPDETISEAAAGAMCAALQTVYAIVRVEAGADELANRLQTRGCRILRCPCADEGMGSVLAWATSLMPPAHPIIVALADMPFIRPATIVRVAAGLSEYELVAPAYAGRRGHPVGFGGRFRAQLQELSGDTGARELLASGRSSLHLIEVDDPGVVFDIDLPSDLARVGADGTASASQS